MPRLVHLLTSQDFVQATVLCGARRATYASPDPAHVTCPVCRGWKHPHGARQTTPPTGITTEKVFQEAVRQMALASSWLYFHVHDSRHSPSGFVDTVLVRGERLICAELKLPGKRPTMAQQTWLDALGGVTHVQTFVWTPDDLEAIVEVLR